MKRQHIFVFCCVVFLGAWSGVYTYMRRGVVSERTIHAIQQKCLRFQSLSRISCLRNELRAIVHDWNIRDVMRAVLLESYHAEDSDTVYNSPNCHALAHLVGETAGVRSDASIPRLFAMCGTGCVYGCVHGMFSGLLRQGKLTKSTIATVCGTEIGSQSAALDREECIHGIGHGLADYLQSDIPSAVSYCENFTTLAEKKMCWDGLFMQVYDPVVQREDTSTLPVDIFVDCRQYPLMVRRICMQSVLSVELSVVRDIGFATSVCASSLQEADQCVEIVDSFLSIDKTSEEFIRTRCKQAEKAVYACIDRFVTTTKSDAQIDSVCAANGIVHRDACLSYMKQQRPSRRIP